MKRIILGVFAAIIVFSVSAQDFYWVGNGGNWKDFSNHWATTSNGTTMHTRFPGPGDNVFFDAFSFTLDSQVVVLDTSVVSVESMTWLGVTNTPEFFGTFGDTMYVSVGFYLASADSMSFNFSGLLCFQNTTPFRTINVSHKDHAFKSDVFINITQGVCNVFNDMLVQQKNLYLFDGALNMHGNNLRFIHLNADSAKHIPLPVLNPALVNIDTIFCGGSFHLDPAFDISAFNGVLRFNSQLVDSNYINVGTHVLNSEIIFLGNKEYFLLGDINTSEEVQLSISGKFYSNNNDILCSYLLSEEPLNRMIDFGQSGIYTQGFNFVSDGLMLNSNQADLFFSGADTLYYITDKNDIIFRNVSVDAPNVMLWGGKMEADSMYFAAGSVVHFADESVVEFAKMEANGNCGEYIEFRTICDEEIQDEDFCVNVLPKFISTNPIVSEYLKLSFVEADGVFTANNSFDEGGVINWTVNEPTAVSTLYWIGNTGDWNVRENWSDFSGGAPSNCIPTKRTNVVFDGNSFDPSDTVMLYDAGYCNSMLWENILPNIVLDGDGKLYMSSDVQLHPNLQAAFNGLYIHHNDDVADTADIITAGVQLNGEFTISGNAHRSFNDAVILNHTLVFESGSMAFNGNMLTVDNFSSPHNNVRTLNFENSIINLKGSGVIWDMDGGSLTMLQNGSRINVLAGGVGTKTFIGADQLYDTLVCQANETAVFGSNSFEFLYILPGSSVALESASVTSVDSLLVSGDCLNTVSLLSTESLSPAVINKTGYDTLSINAAYLRNVMADTTGGRYYLAQQSTWSGNVDGWSFADTLQGKEFHWIGQTASWHDINNWEVGGVPATCLPTILDTVVVDPAVFALAPNDSMLITSNAYCKEFIANGINTRKLNMVFESNLFVGNLLMFDDSVSVNYMQKPELLENEDLFEFGVHLIPQSINAVIHSASIPFGVNLYVNPIEIDDTVVLSSPLRMDTTATLSILSGTFDAMQHQIQVGYFITQGQSPKVVHIEQDTLTVFVHVDIQDNSLLTLHAQESEIFMPGNFQNQGYFDANGQSVHNVSFSSEYTEEENDMVFFCKSSNSFNVFAVYQGITMLLEEGETQTVNEELFVFGSCEKPVNLYSSQENLLCFFNSNNIDTDTIYGTIMKDVSINKIAVAMVSVDDGNNPNWVFDPTPAVDASFIIPWPVCIGDTVVFVNTSSSMFGDLGFQWIIKELVDTNVTNLEFSFDYEGEYEIILIATDTVRKCVDVFTDTLVITNHFVNFSTSVPGLVICAGDSVTFTAASDNSNSFTFYLNGTPLNLGSDTVNVYKTDSLFNNDEIWVEAAYNGCVKSSTAYTFTVNPLPVIVMNCSEPDTTICHGDTIIFTANGADEYEFFVNGVSVSPLSTNNVFSSASLSDSSLVTVYGRISSSDCYDWSSDSYMVRVLPNPVVLIATSVDPAVICQGDNLLVTASGGDLYEFFINGISQGPPAINNIFDAAGLVNNDVITAVGYSMSGCYSLSNSVDVTVNPSPNPVLTCDDVDLIICVGDQVEFFGNGANEYQFFVDGISQGPFSTSNSFITSGLTHGQTVTLEGQIGACVRTAPQILTFQVLPVINLSASLTTICEGENIEFTASGDTIYQFFVDGVPATTLSPVNVFNTTTLTNGQIVTVEGTSGACLPGGITITVNPLPIVTMICSEPDTTICAGNQITFNASGAQQYEFFVDAVSQGPPSLLSFFTTTALTNGQSVSVTGYSSAGCWSVSSDVFTVTVNDYPVVNLSVSDPATSLCAGDTLVFTASGGDEWEFFVSGVSQGVSTNPVFETSSLFNNATVSVYGISNGCAAQAPQTFTYTVYNLPNPVLTPLTPISVCDGDLISIEASGAVEYEFLINGVSQGVPSVNNLFSSATLADGDVISVIGYQNICSKETSSPVTVNVNQVPALTFVNDMPLTGICFGDTITFTSTGALTYLYYVDGIQTGGVNSTGILQLAGLDDGQTVTVTGYNNACFKVADTVYSALVHYVNTVLSANSVSNVFCDNEPVSLSAGGADLYEFFLDGVSLGVPSATSTYNLGTVNSGQYAYVNGTDQSNSCVGQSNIIYFFVMQKPEITATPGLQFCEGDSVTLMSDVVFGNQWYLNTSPIAGATTDTYVAYEGGLYSLIVSQGDDGGVYSIGNNGFGQFGSGNTMPSFNPVQASLNTETEILSAGLNFVAALDVNGSVWAWGNNEWGTLGVGTYSPSSVPLQVASLSNIISITTGYNHVIALKSDSTLVSWGRNTSGQLGYGNFAPSNFPMPVSALTQVIAVCAGENHSLALKADGTVWAWGGNTFGQLGNGNLVTQNSPVQVSGLDSVVYIAAGAFHSMAVRFDGSLWVWGSNQNGQLGTGDFTSSNTPVKNIYVKNVVQVSGGKEHSLALNQKGYLYSWGDNSDGQLGIQAIVESIYPVFTSLKDVEKTVCGLYNSYALRNDGTVWAFGLNNAGQIGDGTTVNVETPQRIESLFGIKDMSAGHVFVSFVTENAHSCQADDVTLIMDSAAYVTITQVGNTLTTIQGQSYQWFLNGNPIPGATTQTINITSQGIYKVEVTFANGCSRMSDDFPYFVSIEEWISEANILILPNPNDGSFELLINMPIEALQSFSSYSLWTISGSVIADRVSFEAQPSQMMNFSSLASGMYYLILHADRDLRMKIMVAE